MILCYPLYIFKTIHLPLYQSLKSMHLVINTHMSIFNINSLKWFISANIEIEFFTNWNILRLLRGSSEPNTEERVRGLASLE